MDWLGWADYSRDEWFSVVMWTAFVLTVAATLGLRRLSWAEAGLLAAFVGLVGFSIIFTVVNGVRSTAALGTMFLWFNLSIVAFPTAGIVRLAMIVVRSLRRPSSAD